MNPRFAVATGKAEDPMTWFSLIENNPTKDLIDVTITSPRYNKKKWYGNDDSGNPISDQTSREVYLEEMRATFALVAKYSKPEARLYINLAPHRIDPGLAYAVVEAISKDWQLWTQFIWLFSGTTPDGKGGELSWGHFTPMTEYTHVVHNCWEWVFQFHRSTRPPQPLDKLALGVPYVDQSNLKRFGEEGRPNLRCRGNMWAIPYPTIQKRGKHPCPFPPELVDACLLIDGAPARGGWVCDPFCGEGNTGISALGHGLSFYGIDRNPDFTTTAIKNCEELL